MLVATAGVAIGLSVFRVGGMPWTYGPLLAVATWMMFGILWQAYDLFTWQRATTLPAGERFGCWFSIIWRLAIAVLFVAYYTILLLPKQGELLLPESEDIFLIASGKDLRDVIFFFGLIIILGSIGLPRSAPRRSIYRNVINVLGAIFGVILAARLLRDIVVVPVLVAIALFGIDASRSLNFTPEALKHGYASQVRIFFWEAWLALGFTVLGGVLIAKMARHWRRPLLRWTCGILAALSLAMPAAFAISTYCWRLQWLAPNFAQGLGRAKSHQWVVALILGAMLVTAVAWQMSHELHPACNSSWRRHAGRYCHERKTFLLITCIVSLLVACVATLGPYVLYNLSVVLTLTGTPLGYLELALFIAAVVALARCYRKEDRSEWNTPSPLAPARFLTVWIALAILLLVALPAIAWSAFASWFILWL